MPAGRSGNHGPFGVGQNLQWNRNVCDREAGHVWIVYPALLTNEPGAGPHVKMQPILAARPQWWCRVSD
jgi:hypothetical protein